MIPHDQGKNEEEIWWSDGGFVVADRRQKGGAKSALAAVPNPAKEKTRERDRTEREREWTARGVFGAAKWR